MTKMITLTPEQIPYEDGCKIDLPDGHHVSIWQHTQRSGSTYRSGGRLCYSGSTYPGWKVFIVDENGDTVAQHPVVDSIDRVNTIINQEILQRELDC